MQRTAAHFAIQRSLTRDAAREAVHARLDLFESITTAAYRVGILGMAHSSDADTPEEFYEFVDKVSAGIIKFTACSNRLCELVDFVNEELKAPSLFTQWDFASSRGRAHDGRVSRKGPHDLTILSDPYQVQLAMRSEETARLASIRDAEVARIKQARSNGDNDKDGNEKDDEDEVAEGLVAA